MRSISLLYILVLFIVKTTSKEIKQSNKKDESGVKYGGPIIYSNESPPLLYFPSPPPVDQKSGTTAQALNISSDRHIEYVPFPYEELPVLIYKSAKNPPIHVVSDNQLDKRHGEVAQRSSRALKSWSQFKLFNDMPIILKAPKISNSEAINSVSNQMLANNTKQIESENPVLLARAPHVVYSGHPPIHVFPHPIVIKDDSNSDMAEMTSASETFTTSVKKGANINNKDDDHYDEPSKPSKGGPHSSGKSNYGGRVRTRKNNNYDNDYSSSESDDKYQSQSQQASHYSNEYSDDEQNTPETSDNYDKEYIRDARSRYAEAIGRDKHPKYNSGVWADMEADNGWLSSLLGYSQWPTRQRRPYTLGSPLNDNFAYALNAPINMESVALMNPHLRNTAWFSALNSLRPAASAIRPVYTLSNLFGYRQRPPIYQMPPYLGALNARLVPSASAMSPVVSKPYGFVSPMIGLPSLAYPIRVPYSPFVAYKPNHMNYAFPNGHHMGGDLSFAESIRNANVSKINLNKFLKNTADLQSSASHSRPTFALPLLRPAVSAQHMKPPIIIYQGLKPPIHVYKPETHLKLDKIGSPTVQSDDNANLLEDRSTTTTAMPSTTTPTDNPFTHLFSPEEYKANSDNNYDTRNENTKIESYYYNSHGSPFSPRLSSSDEWTPVKKVEFSPEYNKRE